LAAVDTVSIRPVRPADDDFLLRVYASTRDDVHQTPWTETERGRFVEMQYRAQRDDYESRFATARHSIILVGGEPHGRIWVDRRADEIRLLDITLLPEFRNQDTGGVLLERLIDEARLAGIPLRHSVFNTNTEALRFYSRLGFEVVEDFEMYVLMEWANVTPRPG
jgi:GNAT superfamily N-acetyltransferase